MGLKEGILNIWSSDYVQKNPNKAYKVTYPSEYPAVAGFLNGGPEPANWRNFSKLGAGLCELEVERRALATEPPPLPPQGAYWIGDFAADAQDFSKFDTHDSRNIYFNDWAVGNTRDITIVPKPAGSIYKHSDFMCRVIANNKNPSNSNSGQTVNLWQPGAYGQPWVKGNTVWCRSILVIPDGTDPRYPGKLTPVPGDGVDNDFHVVMEWHKNDGAGAPGPTSSKLETSMKGGKPCLIFKPIGGLAGAVHGKYLFETDAVQNENNSNNNVTGNVQPLKFNHEYDLLFEWVLDPDPAKGKVRWYVDGNLRADVKIGTMFQKSDGSTPGLSFQSGMYRSYPFYGGRATDTTDENEHIYIVAMLAGPTRESVGA